MTTRLELLQSALLLATGLLLQPSGYATLRGVLFVVSCSYFRVRFFAMGLPLQLLGYLLLHHHSQAQS